MEWFGSASSIEELKGEYLNLLKKWKNDADLMAEINAQYEDLLASFGEELNKKIDEDNKELAPEKQKKHYEVDKDKFAKELAEYERLRGKVTVSWDTLYRLADGCGIGDLELKAKDNARAQITQIAFEEGFNLECMESPEEGIDSFLECYPQYDRFDLDGNMRR